MPWYSGSAVLNSVEIVLFGGATQATASANATASKISVIDRLQAAEWSGGVGVGVGVGGWVGGLRTETRPEQVVPESYLCRIT